MQRWPNAILLIALQMFAMLLCCVGLGYLLGHEELASFDVGAYQVNVYAEGAFHYEPPGFIYFSIKQWGRTTTVPERRFMGIGGERVPRTRFSLIKTNDEEIIALVLENEIEMIHEFSSGFTWPGPHTNVTEHQWEAANPMIEKLRQAHPSVKCSRQDQYRRDLDRIKRTGG